LKFIIVDGYPAKSREQFNQVGMKVAGQLYKDMLVRYLPNAECEIINSSDPGVELPSVSDLENYAGVLWPGCNLTVYHDHDERVTKVIDMVKRAYTAGVPQFGSCWGAQIAVYAVGGKVAVNPKGREMGIARKIRLTDDGKNHPMYKGKATAFDGFISHDDEITELPHGAELLAGNEFSKVQAVAVKHEKGVFWAPQYHPEYDLHELARLIVARKEKMLKYNFFNSSKDIAQYVKDLETVHSDPSRKDLRWKYAIDDDVLDASIRQLEFINWINEMVLP
jgi:GMP synthase (glutamine-hydrolysing)